jgi:putative heme-binding domain-containing protein
MRELRPEVAAVLQSEPMNTSLFLATLAALEMLDGKDPKDFDQTPAGQYVLPLLRDADTPDQVKVQALRLVDPADPALTADVLRELLDANGRAVRVEAVRTVAFSPLAESRDWLLSLAAADEADETVRAEAILGLANVVARDLDSGETASEMCALLPNLNFDLKAEMFRSLRGVAADPEVLEAVLDSVGERTGRASAWTEIDAQLRFLLPEDRTARPRRVLLPEPDDRPASDQEWRVALETSPDGEDGHPDRGRRVFFHPNGPRCYVCHTVNGRGGNIGPDLSTIGRARTRERLIDSILEPGREIAPQFTTWSMLTTDGHIHTGMIVHENKGTTVLGTLEGERIELQTIDIDLRTPQRTSVMPDRLEERVTVGEFRDLLAFLQSLGHE